MYLKYIKLKGIVGADEVSDLTRGARRLLWMVGLTVDINICCL